MLVDATGIIHRPIRRNAYNAKAGWYPLQPSVCACARASVAPEAHPGRRPVLHAVQTAHTPTCGTCGTPAGSPAAGAPGRLHDHDRLPPLLAASAAASGSLQVKRAAVPATSQPAATTHMHSTHSSRQQGAVVAVWWRLISSGSSSGTEVGALTSCVVELELELVCKGGTCPGC